MTSGSRSGRRLWSIAIGLLFSATFLWMVLRRLDLRTMLGEMGRVDLPVLALNQVAILAGFLLMSLRSRVIFAPLHRFSLSALFRSVLVAFAGNNLLPLRAGELLRVERLARQGGLHLSSCLAVVATERLLDLLCMAVLTVCMLPVLGGLRVPVVLATAGGVVLMLLVFFGLARRPAALQAVVTLLTRPLGDRVRTLAGSIAERFAAGLKPLAAWSVALRGLGLSLAYWFSALLGTAVWIRAAHFELPWYGPAVVQASTALGVALPSSPASVGTYHYFVTFALTRLGVPMSTAASVAILVHLANVVPFSLFTIVLLFVEGMLGSGPRGRLAQ